MRKTERKKKKERGRKRKKEDEKERNKDKKKRNGEKDWNILCNCNKPIFFYLLYLNHFFPASSN
jgi:hypothetical protein